MLLINDDKEKIKKGGGGDKWCPEEGRQMLGLIWKTGTEKKNRKKQEKTEKYFFPSHTLTRHGVI